jgi:hypothetical protein
LTEFRVTSLPLRAGYFSFFFYYYYFLPDFFFLFLFKTLFFCLLIFIAANRDLLPGDSRGYRSAEEAARELTQGIRREVTKLAERWAALRDRTERWNVDLDTTTNVNDFFSFPLFLFYSHL